MHAPLMLNCRAIFFPNFLVFFVIWLATKQQMSTENGSCIVKSGRRETNYLALDLANAVLAIIVSF